MAWPEYTTTQMTRPGAVNNGNDPYELILTQFGGEVLASFERARLVSRLVFTKSISNGKSAQFPLVGRAKAHYHKAGTRVVTDAIKSAERTITVPGMITASTFWDNFEQAVMHYDVRRQHAEELGFALADLREIHTIIMLAKASHAVKAIDDADQMNGKWITNDKFKMGTGGSATKMELAAALCEAIYMAQVAMDMANVRREGRRLVLRPTEYYSLLEGIADVAGYAINRDFGGQGSYADGVINRIGGVEILCSNMIPSTNLLSSEDNYQYYNGDFSKLIGVIWREEAVGCLELMGASTETGWVLDYQGDLTVAKQAYGLGVLRPECSVALELDTLTNG